MLNDLKEACCAANKELARSGLVDLTFGNASLLDVQAGIFAIKPSGVPYDQLTPDLMVLIDLGGMQVEGGLRPSSDTPTHRRLLREFAERGVRSVVHTHSRQAVAFAQAAFPVPCLGTTHSDYFYGTIPVTRPLVAEEIATDYEWNTGGVIVECLAGRDPLEMPAVLVHHHGPFTWGSSAAKAVEAALALEIVADMAGKTLALRPEGSNVPDVLLRKHFFRKHGPTAYYGQRETTRGGEGRGKDS